MTRVTASARRTVVLGDLHLTRFSPDALADDVANLLDEHRGARVIVAGDFFDLVTDAPHQERRETVRAVLGAHPQVRRALGEFLEHDGDLLFCGGNHDADLGRDDVRPALLDAIAPPANRRDQLRSTPWFFREGGLHIEHGHFYDPDNTPAHPLVVGEPSLGVHFSAEFMSPTGAHRYLSHNDGKPLELFLSAFRWYGMRAPYVVATYFRAAFGALAKAGPFYRAHGEREVGDAKQARFAIDAGVPAAMVDQLMSIGAPSTLESWSATFARLYLDRAMASIFGGAGLGAFLLGYRRSGGAAAMLGATALAASWMRKDDRYSGAVVDHLSHAATRIADTTDAKLVIFGHTHREALEDRYANTGSFAFPRDAPGRPFLEIEQGANGPRALRRYFGQRPTAG
jgi:UDP-2,3-diacylglucosamine pyrophosphatase LpxH